MIAVRFTLGISVDSFGAAAQQTFKSNLAAQLDGVAASDIQLTVEAGSLVVAVRILDPATGDIDTLVTALSSDQFVNTLSTELGYSIEAASVPLVESVAPAAQGGSARHCAADHSDNHETWTIELESPPTAEQQALVRRKVKEYSHLDCEADLEIEWDGVIGALRLLGGDTRDTLAHHEKRQQATHRSELLLEQLHRTHGVLENGPLRAHLVAFHWHRPFYQPWALSFFAPKSYPFELFTSWLAAPLTAMVAVGVVLIMRNEPHFAGLVGIIASLPTALLLATCRKQRPAERQRMVAVVKTGIAAFLEAWHYWHTVLFVYEIWRSPHPDLQTAWQTVSLVLLMMPVALVLLVIIAFVVLTMNSTHAQHIEPVVVRRHPRCIALVILLAALHIELFALLPWRTTSWAGYPSQGVLMSVILLLLLKKLSMLVLSVYLLRVEPSAFGVYILVLSAVSLTQVLLEKALLLAAGRAEARALSSQVSIKQQMKSAGAPRTPSTLLPESLDQVLLTIRVRRLHPMLRPAQQWILHSPGVLRAVAADSEMRITSRRLYIEQAAGAAGVAEEADSIGLLEQWPLATLVSVKRRRYEMRHVALELILATQQDGRPGAQASVLLGFNSHDDRERVVQTLLSERPQLLPPDECLQEMTDKWHEGEIDNYTYLLHLNDCASRSFRDLSQYPIMCAFARSPSHPRRHCYANSAIACGCRPWVLSDYSSESLDLDNPRSFGRSGSQSAHWTRGVSLKLEHGDKSFSSMLRVKKCSPSTTPTTRRPPMWHTISCECSRS